MRLCHPDAEIYVSTLLEILLYVGVFSVVVHEVVEVSTLLEILPVNSIPT